MTAGTTVVTVDTWASEPRPGDTHGPDPVLILNEGTNVRKWVYVKAAPPWPGHRAVTVVSAVLRFRLHKANPAGATTVRARRIEEAWAQGTLAWKRRPAVVGADDATVVVASAAVAGTLVELDVTTALQAVVDGAPYFGFRLDLTPGTVRGPLKLVSASGRPLAERPRLVVDWVAPPDDPTNLEPGGGRYISITKPSLAWQFGDSTEPDPHQSGLHVQIDDAEDFLTPVFDTGQVVSGTSGLDLAATAYGGFPTSLRWWRVRVADESGVWSEWSEPAQTRYGALGVVNITSPGATTSDLRPTVIWTWAPGAVHLSPQKVWRARIERLVGNAWVRVADSGDVTGTDLQWTPDRSLPKVGGTYRAVLEVLDGLDRQARKGASDRAVDIQQFTYAPGGGAAAPTGLTATVVDGFAVRLNWTRATLPDYYVLVADGDVVVEEFDVVPSGTAYQWTWYGARPREPHSLSLHAVVITGGVVSTSPGATVSVQTSPTGIWLVDAYDGRKVHIAGKEPLAASLAESSTLHPRIGDRAPVLVTEIVRGYEGSVGGVLVDWDTLVAREMKETLIDLREDGVDLRVVLGDLNLPVLIYEVEANPTPAVGDSQFDAAFSFVQRAEFDRL